MQYITDTINDDKNWNVIRHIKDFGRNIFKDFYKEHSDTLETTIGEATFLSVTPPPCAPWQRTLNNA